MRPLHISACALSGSALLALAGCSSGGDLLAERADVIVVQRGDLQIRVTEQAELQPSQSTRIKNEMEGQSTIIFLIEEGVVVEKGEKLVELDAANLLERRAQQGITLHKAKAALTTAEKELEIRKKEFEADKLGGENTVKMAMIDIDKFYGRTKEDGTQEMGEQKQQQLDAEANIQLARAEIKLSENTLSWSRKLQEKGFITKDELERDELDYQRRLNNLQVAQNQADILVNFTHPKERIRLDQARIEADTNLEGIVARGEAKIAQADADLEAKRKEHELAQERYDNLEQQIKNATIFAPTPGLVVYAQGGDRRGRSEIVEEGAPVRERQNLIMLPDVTHMVAKLKVHEAVVDKVKPGQAVRLKCDAFAGQEFEGRVTRVSPVADSGSRWSNNDLKVYKTDIEIIGKNTVLKPGMSATATIVVADLKNVVFLPMQAVFRQGYVPYVWVETADGGAEARKIEVGMNDFEYVEITKGLTEGERIYLAKPPDAIEPEFAQPAPAVLASAPAGETSAPSAATPAKSEDDESERGKGRGERGGRRKRERGPMTKAFYALLEEKHPDLKRKLDEEGFSAWRDAGLREAIEDDPELKAARDAMMSEAMRGRGSRGGGEGRGSRGGGRGGRGSRGDGERRGSRPDGNR